MFLSPPSSDSVPKGDQKMSPKVSWPPTKNFVKKPCCVITRTKTKLHRSWPSSFPRSRTGLFPELSKIQPHDLIFFRGAGTVQGSLRVWGTPFVFTLKWIPRSCVLSPNVTCSHKTPTVMRTLQMRTVQCSHHKLIYRGETLNFGGTSIYMFKTLSN